MRVLLIVAVACAVIAACSAFNTAYDATTSRQFDAMQSTSFEAHTEVSFDLNYADSTHLHGFEAVEYVEMGQFRARVPVGVITDCNSPDFNGVDGILGFGCKKRSQNLPTPLFWAMTDPMNEHSNARHIERKFSFFSTQTSAELQLGGYDPETVVGDLWFTPTLAPTDFIVGVSSLTFGADENTATELINFSPLATQTYLPSIMDSGTSCLVIPGTTLDGQLTNVPFNEFAKKWQKGFNFWITINGRKFEIPFEAWYLAASDETCVQQSPGGMNGLLVGDVFFREYLVLFDMQDEEQPVIGIGKRNKAYAPVTEAKSGFYTLEQSPVAKFPVGRRPILSQMVEGQMASSTTEVDQIPVTNKKGTQYFVDLQMGTPPQSFTVIFDTGSSVFGVFVKSDTLPASVRAALSPNELMQVSETTRRESMTSIVGQDLDSQSIAFCLVVMNAIALAGVLYVRKARRGAPLSHQCAGHEVV